jgi:hypothetical protein
MPSSRARRDQAGTEALRRSSARGKVLHASGRRISRRHTRSRRACSAASPDRSGNRRWTGTRRKLACRAGSAASLPRNLRPPHTARSASSACRRCACPEPGNPRTTYTRHTTELWYRRPEAAPSRSSRRCIRRIRCARDRTPRSAPCNPPRPDTPRTGCARGDRTSHAGKTRARSPR